MENNHIKDGFNYGLAILRSLMCFEVLLNHFWVPLKKQSFWLFEKLLPVAVPVFMILSFYLMGRHFLNYSIQEVKARLWRIYYPQIGWGGVYFLFYIIYDYIFGEKYVELSDLFFQITLGHSINQSMWYQFVLLVITIIFYGIFRTCSEKKSICILVILSIISLVSQYLGIGYYLFSSLRMELSYPLGRLIEVFPYATIGFLLYYFNVFKKIINFFGGIYLPVICFSCILVVLLVTNIFPTEVGFGYSGLDYIFTAFCIVIIFYLLNGFAKNAIYKNIVVIATKYTLGIYCMHRLVGNVFVILFDMLHIPVDGFTFCIFIYICCYFIASIMAKIFFLRKLVE